MQRRVGLLAVTATALTLAACGATADPVPTLPVSTPVPHSLNPDPYDPSHPIGETVRTADGALTVVHVTRVAAEIRECAGDQPLTVSPAAWSAQWSGEEVHAVPSGSATPALTAINLTPHACADGWVSFPMPAGVQLERVMPPAPVTFYWTR